MLAENYLFFISSIILHFFKSTTSQEIIFENPPQSDSCTTFEGALGHCVEIWRCPSEATSVGTRPPKHCGFNKQMPIVCCPLTDTLSKIRRLDEVTAPIVNFECGIRLIKYSFIKRKRKKRQIGDQLTINNLAHAQQPLPELPEFPEYLPPPPNFDSPGIGLPEFPEFYVKEMDFPHILLGERAVRNSWPWMVLLWRQRGPEKIFFCGGTLINPRFVITAAHCVLSFDPFSARLGEHDHTEFTDIREDVEVKNVTFHTDYDVNLGYYDIALLELAREVIIKEEVRPICLPWGKEIKKNLVNEAVTMAGWGKDGFGSSGSPSPVLLEVDLTVFETEVCRRSYSELPDYSKTFPNGMMAYNILCAGDVEGGKDTCEGDSGGPLMMHRDSTNTFSLVGVISKGIGCGDKKFPGLNAPVANLDTLQWIKDTAFSNFSF